MAETQLKDLLEDFDNEFPNPLFWDEASKKHSVSLLNSACSAGISRLGSMQDRTALFLSSEGISLLIQMRTKKSIDDLNHLIKEFDMSSRKFSNALFWLTLAYTLFSLLIVLKEFFPKIFRPF